jgi:hypothetical protein
VHLLAVRTVSVAGPWTDAAVIAAPMAMVLVAAVTGVVTWAVRRQSKAVDQATEKKTRAEEAKTRAEAESVQVKTALELLASVRLMLAEQQREYEGRLSRVSSDHQSRLAQLAADHQAQLKALAERIAGTEDDQRRLRAAFASHQTWDADAVATLRQINPEWPDPPPISLD